MQTCYVVSCDFKPLLNHILTKKLSHKSKFLQSLSAHLSVYINYGFLPIYWATSKLLAHYGLLATSAIKNCNYNKYRYRTGLLIQYGY